MPFIWFWTFWHWSREGHRTGALLRDPVHGLGSHWDEWYRHEASAEERRAIEETGRSARQQRLFMTWLVRHWAPGAEWRGERPPARFALWQLAGFSPFDGWTAFAPYRTIAGGRGVSAVVLAEHSAGEASDVRPVDALAIPADRDPAAPAVVAHGFSVAADELTTARQAVLRLLRGRGLLRLLVVWLVAGRRPYPRALRALLAAGWLGVCALIAWLLLGPEPGERLLSMLAAVLAALWGTLALAGIGTGAAVVLQAWRAGRALGGRLDRSQVRLRMDGGLTLVGGSAGVVFALTTLRAIGRGAVHARPRGQPRSWLWGRLVRALGPQAACWAATGVITADGRVRPVVLAPKLRACLRHPHIAHLVTPGQRAPWARATARLAEPAPSAVRPDDAARAPAHRSVRLGFAAGRTPLRSHRCAHLVDVVLTMGGMTSARQAAANAVAVAASALMLVALPDLRAIVLPPPAPAVTTAFSPSPYVVRMRLDTPYPSAFGVVLESKFWANRRARPSTGGWPGTPAYAELRLTRAPDQITRDVQNGRIWVERRRRFLTREFTPGERVGDHSLGSLLVPR